MRRYSMSLGMRCTLLVLFIPTLYVLTFPVVDFYAHDYARSHDGAGAWLELYSRPYYGLCEFGHLGDNLIGYKVIWSEALSP
jgi:hypothetical protein